MGIKITHNYCTIVCKKLSLIFEDDLCSVREWLENLDCVRKLDQGLHLVEKFLYEFKSFKLNLF